MAKIIFTKTGEVYRIAQDQAFLDANKNFDESTYDILDITTEEFNAVKKKTKRIVSHNGSTVTLETIDRTLTPGPLGNIPSSEYETADRLNSYREYLIETFEFYLRFNADKPLATTVTSYLPILKELDVPSIVPLNKSLEEYLIDQGHTVVVDFLELL
tara:strand:+ start:197 stop:670 length:474 start_codon:yes stop_codon:yes gene_type:complete